MAERPIERLHTGVFGSGLRVETRSMPGGNGPSHVIGGYAAVFGKRSHPMGGMREVVEPSFFNKSQADGWPMAVARFEHDPKMLLGSIAGGTLDLRLDVNGLDYSVQLPKTRDDVWELAERRDLPGSSFSFQAYQDDWRLGDGGIPQRHLVTGRLIDVAPTAIPAYPDSTVKVSMRSLATWAEADEEEVERALNEGRGQIFFKRTDNIDPKENHMGTTPESESRSTPTVESAPPYETHVHVHMEGNRSESKAPEPGSKPEEKPEVTAPQEKPDPKPESPGVKDGATPPPVEATSTTAQPEQPASAPEATAPQAPPGLTDLLQRRNRLLGNRPDDPIAS